jgi:hypothetical protein
MKANLTFDLDDQNDAAAHLRCIKANDLVLCIAEFRTQLFSQFKYDEVTIKEKEMLFNITALLDETMQEYCIDLTELNR